MSEIAARPYNKDYEITDAMFGAFRSPGGTGLFWKLLGWTTLLYTLIYVLFLPPIIRGYVRMFSGLGEMETMDAEELTVMTDAMNASLLSMVPAFIALTLGSFLILAVVRAAFYRSYFHNAPVGFFPFRLGGDEWRQFLSQLGYWGLFFVFYLGFIFAIVIVAGLIGGIAAVSGGGDGAAAAGVLLGLLVVVLYIGMICFFVWFLVKFAPASALTGLRRKTHVFAARHVSKNRFWALFGSFLVAGIIAYVTAYIFIIIGAIVGLSGLFSGGLFEQLGGDDPSAAFETMTANASTVGFKIKAFFGILLLCAGSAFYSLMLLGPSAYFTRQWDESDPTRAFE